MPHIESIPDIGRLREGDDRAYQDLVLEYGPRLLGAAERLGHSPQDAEDLVQDVFLELVRSVERFEGRSTIFTWLYRVLFYRHSDLVRRKGVERKKRPPPTKVLANLEVGREESIRAAMDRLPESEKRVLFLRFFEGLSYDEIAPIVGSPLGTVHSQTFHGLRRLKALLEEAS